MIGHDDLYRITRAVNVAGHNRVRMSDLRELLTDLGTGNVRSLLQTGNLVFEGSAGKTKQLEGMFEVAAKDQLGLETDFLVRTHSQWIRIVADNPFHEAERSDPGHLLVMMLKESASRASVALLREAIRGREIVWAQGPQVYLVYPDGIGRSRLTTKLIEGTLGVRGTGRNWNTVLKLDAVAREF